MDKHHTHVLLVWFGILLLFQPTESQTPVLTIGTGSLVNVAEDASVGTSIYQCAATDSDPSNTDAGTLRYYINPPVDGLFVDANNCNFYVVPGLDYEASTTITGSLTVEDKSGATDVASFSFNVTDANDNYPTCTYITIVGELLETAATGDVIGTFTCTDADEAGSVNSDIYFQVFPVIDSIDINTTTGQVTLKRTVDYETDGPSITATVRISDQGTTELTTTGTIVLQITDVDDNIPTFDAASYTATVSETVSIGTTVINLNATDLDAANTDNSKITYSLISACSPDVLLIDSVTGDLVLKSTLDYESSTNVTCDISAYSSTKSSDLGNTTFTLTVEDVNDVTPTFNDTYFSTSVTENSVTGTVVTQLIANDTESGVNGLITYGITDSTNTFTIDSSTGEVKVQTAPDYENATSYLVIVTAQDSGTPTALTSSVYLQILIDPVNEFTPSFTGSTAIPDIPENTVPGTSIYNVSISDSDSGVDGTITYTMVTTGVPFFVDSEGVIRVTTNLDYETQTSYQFVIQAADNSATTVLSATATYSVTITDVDDVPLTCDSVSTLAITGPAALTFTQVTINCTDPDTSSGTVSYSIAQGDTDSAWAINSAGQLSLQSNPTQTQYDLVIAATDGADSATVNFTVFVETTLQFNSSMSVNTTIDENTSGTTLVTASACCVFGEVVYSIISGNSDNKVAMTSSTGDLVHLLPYDRDTTASYEYVLQAVSTSGQTATVTYTVTVTDVNDNTPLFSQNVYNIAVVESLAPSAPINTYTATDADDGVNAALTYSITSGNGAGTFALDSASGALSLSGALDYETTQTYTLVLEAVDGGSTPLTGTTTVVISVTDADETAPTVIPAPGTYSISLSEDVSVGASVFDVDATDTDLDSSISYALQSGNTDTDFGIDFSTGYVYVAKFLDRERTATYTLIVTATDTVYSTTATATITVTINDVNDNDPVFTPSVFEFNVDHNAGPGTSVGTLVVADADDGANAALTTTIIAGGSGTFVLTGLQLDTNSTVTMDYTTVSQYRLTVQSVDGGSPARTSTTAVVVNVLPNTAQPDFGSTTTATVSLNEDTDVGYEVYDADATHQGAVEDGTTLYSIDSGNTGSSFGIRQRTGEVYIATALDYETTQSYTLVIGAQNSVVTANTASFTLTVSVLNINEFDPVFDQLTANGQNSFSFEIDESANMGDAVGTVLATDDDTGSPGTVTHSLSGTGSADFAIDGASGAITVNAALDYTVTNVYNLIATATDAGSTARAESVSVVIRVIDSNNNSPVFTSANTAEVLDSATVGSEFFHVHATDADTGSAGTIKYSFVSDPSVGKISIDADTGILTVTGQLDSALESSYVFSVKAADEGVPSLETTSSLTVTVISTVPNYYDPVFAASTVSATVSRDAATGTTVVAVSATDSDSGASGQLVHKIVSGNVDGYFLIDRSSGTITTAAIVLIAEDTYSLIVEATDQGVPSRAANVTVDISVSPARTTLITPDYIFTIAEDASIGDTAGEILQDAGRTTSAYTINSGNYGTSFSIARDGSNGRGVITTLQTLDYETFQNFSLLITVTTDIGDFPKVVEIQVTDVNDNPPTFSSNSLTLSLSENMPVGYTVTTISLSDADTLAINQDNVLSLSNPGPDLFSITQDGALVISTSPDYEVVGSQRIFDVVAADQQPPQTSATVTVTVNIVDVVEDEERRHSATTTNAMISLGVHFPASNGDIIHVLTPGDFGITDNSSATIEYDEFSRNYPFSLTSTGNLYVTDAASLNHPKTYYHWSVIRFTNDGVTTSRASLLRIDTYDRDTHMAVFEFSEDVATIRSSLWQFIFRCQSYLPSNQRLGISNLIDTSTNTARRRLLQSTTKTAAYVYVISDTTMDNMENINTQQSFLTVDQILAVFQLYTDGSPIRGLTSSAITLTTVEPFSDNHGNTDFAKSTAGIATFALLALLVLLIAIVIWFCCWWRNEDEDLPPDWKKTWRQNKRKKKTSSESIGFFASSSDQDVSRPGSAPESTDYPKAKPWYMDESYERFLASTGRKAENGPKPKTISFATTPSEYEIPSTRGTTHLSSENTKMRSISVATPVSTNMRSISVANPETTKTRSISVANPENVHTRSVSVSAPRNTKTVAVNPSNSAKHKRSKSDGQSVPQISKVRSVSVTDPEGNKEKVISFTDTPKVTRRVGVVNMEGSRKSRAVSVARMESAPKSSAAASVENGKSRSISTVNANFDKM